MIKEWKLEIHFPSLVIWSRPSAFIYFSSKVCWNSLLKSHLWILVSAVMSHRSPGFHILLCCAQALVGVVVLIFQVTHVPVLPATRAKPVSPGGLWQTHGFPVFYPNIEKMPLSLQYSFVWCACVCARTCMHMCVCVCSWMSVWVNMHHSTRIEVRGQPWVFPCLPSCFVWNVLFLFLCFHCKLQTNWPPGFWEFSGSPGMTDAWLLAFLLCSRE